MPPTTPSLGTLIRVGNDFLFSGEWWVAVFPGVARRARAFSESARGLATRCAQPEAALIVRSTIEWRLRSFEVKRLRVEFASRRGTLVAVDDVSFHIEPGEVLGIVGESGSGKSLAGMAIIGLLEPPGRVGAGEILLEGQRIDKLSGEALRRLRGRRIGAIFQDPLTSLNPLYTIGRQITETILAHLPVSRSEARDRRMSRCSLKSAFRAPSGDSITTRTSSPAACVSA